MQSHKLSFVLLSLEGDAHGGLMVCDSGAICYGVLDILFAGCLKVVDVLHDVGADLMVFAFSG
ncbi:hypothetical protein DEO72_LG5g2843 [Vigna unguiculata]|nr:hypothetical protein DEO72_LG5g2843 [Vigna unguiculata]